MTEPKSKSKPEPKIRNDLSEGPFYIIIAELPNGEKFENKRRYSSPEYAAEAAQHFHFRISRFWVIERTIYSRVVDGFEVKEPS